MLVSAISFTTISYFEKHSLYTKHLIERGDLIQYDKDRIVLRRINLKKIIEKDLLKIHPDAKLKELVQLVRKSKRNIFPVVNDSGGLEGIVTLDQIRQDMFDPERQEEVIIRNIMIKHPASVSLDEDMESVMNKFQELKIIKFDELQNMINQSDAEVMLVNFWATWCGPCIKEIPHFEEVNQMPDAEVVLVSLDFPEDKDKVQAFIRKKGVKSPVVLLDESNYDWYIEQIDPDWSGALPATLLMTREGSRKFYEKAFTREDLLKEVNRYAD
ncbi:resA [Symbiodinium microadriaticum]|nr:resA [Symbiodinium microadriaticum]